MTVHGRSRFWTKEKIQRNREDPNGVPVRMFALSLSLSEENRRTKTALEVKAKEMQRRNAGYWPAISRANELFDLTEFKDDDINLEEQSFDTTKLDMISINNVIEDMNHADNKSTIVDLRGYTDQQETKSVSFGL